jgi:hypothetical protein
MLTTNPALGVYDYSCTFGSFHSRTDLTYDVTFFWWSAWYVKGSVNAACNAACSRGRIPVITVQPNHDPAIGTAANLLTDVAVGRYDAKFRLIASEMVAYNGPVIIRFAHEMDFPPNATQNGGSVRLGDSGPRRGFSGVYRRMESRDESFSLVRSAGEIDVESGGTTLV